MTLKPLLTALFVLALQGTLLMPAAEAMQNIKCIKNEVGALASRWSQRAGEARSALSAEGGQAEATKGGAINELVREGQELATACKACEARKEAERVRELASRLRSANAALAGQPKPDAKALGRLLDTLAQIEGLKGEFGL